MNSRDSIRAAGELLRQRGDRYIGPRTATLAHLAHADAVPMALADTSTSVPEITFSALLKLLRRNLLPICAAAILTTATAIVALIFIHPLYRAEAVLVVDKHAPIVPADSAVAVQPPALEISDSEVASAVDLIMSVPVLEHVATELKLDQDPEFNKALGRNRTRGSGLEILDKFQAVISDAVGRIVAFFRPVAVQDARLDVLTALTRALSVTVKDGSHSIVVQATARDPLMAARIANALAAAAVGQEKEEAAEDTQRMKSWLDNRLNELSARLAQSEDEIERLRANTGRFEGQNSTILAEQLSQISKELLDARAQLAAAQAKHGEIGRLARGAGGPASASEVMASRTVGDLRGQEAKVAGELALAETRFGPANPAVTSLKAQLAALRRSVREETSRIVSEASGRVRSLETEVADIGGAKAALEARVEGQRSSEVRLKDLQSDASSNRATLEAFSLFRAKMAGLPSLKRPDLSIVSPARPPQAPAWPNRLAVVVGVGLGTLIIGCLVAVLRVSLDQRVRSADQIGALLGLPTVALIPLARRRADPAAAIVAAPTSAVAEAVRYLYTAVDAARGGRAGFRVLITSALPGEGKSTTALMLARQASLIGARSLLVRLDLRGASRLMVPGGDYETEITTEEQSGVSILTVHTRGESGFKALYLQEFWDRLDEVRTSRDLVIIDLPPVLSVSDTRIITRFSDMTIFLMKWGATKTATAAEAVRQLRLTGAAIDCAVLTQVDPRRHATYGYSDLGIYVGAHQPYYWRG